MPRPANRVTRRFAHPIAGARKVSLCKSRTYPPSLPSPTDLIGAGPGRFVPILAEYKEADHQVAEAILSAPEERKDAELRRRQELRRAFADRFLAPARESAGDPATIDDVISALTWVIVQCPDDPQGRQAVERLLQGPIVNVRLEQV